MRKKLAAEPIEPIHRSGTADWSLKGPMGAAGRELRS